MIDDEGYRLNVGIILCNQDNELLWARRIGQDAWQFPQGGIRQNESPYNALLRELNEEVGLSPDDITVMGSTKDWLKYDLPKHLIRHGSKPLCVGQKQIWYLLKMISDDEKINLNLHEKPEFEEWRWVDYWFPLQEVVSFKHDVYMNALKELAPLINRKQ